MANRQYVGARYVPKFYQGSNGNEWDSGVAYEALTMVTYLSNTYCSKKPVPARTVTPNNDPEYWVLTAAYSSQTAELREELENFMDSTGDNFTSVNGDIDDLEEAISHIPTKRKFVLVGDSFAHGIIDSVTPWTDGWINYFNNKFPNRCFYYDPAQDPSFEGVSGFLSSQPFMLQLEYVYNNKLGTVSPNEITDVIIIGGSNEPDNSDQQLATYISTTLKTYLDSHFPNAKVSIGCFGLNARKLVYTNKAFNGYKQGCLRAGYNFLEDLINLGTKNSYASSGGHFTADGYAVYNPYVVHCALYGKVDYQFENDYNVTLNTSEATIPGSSSFLLVMKVTNKYVGFRLISTTTYRGYKVINNKDVTSGNISIDAFTFSDSIYTAFVDGSVIDTGSMLKNGGINSCVNIALIVGEVTSTHKIRFSGFAFDAYSVKTDAIFNWNGTAITRAEVLQDIN